MEPRRIVSLVPSDSYTLACLGVADRIVARTEYCVAPPELSRIETVGGTKNADVERIIALAPDLVICNREENRQIDIERLEAAGLGLFCSFPKTVAEGLAHAERLAALLGALGDDNRAAFAAAHDVVTRLSLHAPVPVPCFVPIWMDPLMTVHGDTFISDALELAGGRNVFSDRARRYPLSADLGRRAPLPPERIVGRDTRYPRVTLDEVVARTPALVLLPDEPHAFSERDADVFRARDLRVRFCDGKDLMWYGLRATEGLERLADIITAAVAAPAPTC
jgi:ABC-type Fe3+-hydroxamate transport system substrate-binding protein